MNIADIYTTDAFDHLIGLLSKLHEDNEEVWNRVQRAAEDEPEVVMTLIYLMSTYLYSFVVNNGKETGLEREESMDIFIQALVEAMPSYMVGG